MADVIEIVAGALVLVIAGAIATLLLARRWALRIERATWRQERAKRKRD
jgi:hypothetical protein